ncbi:choice-of-anchor H family protein [Shewanella avicenniae]|uniref:Choice-of-anchor H family protein n=1 Tax=Shewanella avicenniae TaxID=2814294 RepID=A0ABX7QT27_9GAMM|nr:choice-of-anchor H family protein [Shewanella avicenniae]QSX34636.1 choice-of-anchor H family protein [Shewanella avicenniae]
MKTLNYVAVLVASLTFGSMANAAEQATVNVIEYGVDHSQAAAERQKSVSQLQLMPQAATELNTLSREQKQAEISASVATANKSKLQAVSSLTQHSYYHEFSFFSAEAYLLSDDNYDGFYHSFSLNFDADVYGAYANESVPVYAVIYISRNGGDWTYLHTTDVFYLQGSSAFDSYEVITSLDSGYPTDHYDILIDLYELGYDDIVATISSDDTNSLYALPLQSYNRDQVYDSGYQETVVVSGGSLSALVLLGLGLVGWRRRIAA